MPSDKKKDNTKGSVGFFYAGTQKVGACRVFSSDESKPETVYNEMRENYGRYVTCKYVNCEDTDKVLKNFKKELADTHDFGDIYNAGAKNAADALRKATGGDKVSCHTIKESDPRKKTKKDEKGDTDDDDGDKPTKKGSKKSKDEDEDESSSESEGEKPSKKSDKKSKKTSDGEESDNGKPTKKSSKKGKNHSDGEESGNESDKKKDKKGSKSSNKSK